MGKGWGFKGVVGQAGLFWFSHVSFEGENEPAFSGHQAVRGLKKKICLIKTNKWDPQSLSTCLGAGDPPPEALQLSLISSPRTGETRKHETTVRELTVVYEVMTFEFRTNPGMCRDIRVEERLEAAETQQRP